MRIGIFTSVFARVTLGERLAAVRGLGVDCVQFDLSSAGLASMLERIEAQWCAEVREAFAARGVALSAVDGTFNMVHPDIAVRREGLLDYPLYLSRLRRAGFDGPLILHGLTEAQAGTAVAFLRRTLAEID